MRLLEAEERASGSMPVYKTNSKKASVPGGQGAGERVERGETGEEG